MLQHEHSEAADARVTATELASALASLQTRKEASDQHLGSTIALGEAVRELALAATPEEILAEVWAQRAAQSRRIRLGPKRRRIGLVAVTGALLLLSGVLTLGTVTGTPPPLPPLMVETAADFQQKVLVQDQTAQGPLVRTLAEVPEGRTVRASANAVVSAVVYRLPQRGPMVLSSQAEPYLTWPVVKLGDDLYVRGWVHERLSDRAARLATVEVYNRPNAPALGPHPVPITLRLTSGVFGNVGTIYESQQKTGAERFFFANLRLNKYAWVKW